MIEDKFTKAIMTLIAVSLFMIALNPWIAPTKAYAEVSNETLRRGLGDIAVAIMDINCSK
jgi:hypothetical protein